MKPTNDTHNNDYLFDLGLLDQMCSRLDINMQDKLDLGLNVKLIDKQNNKCNLLSEYELIIYRKSQGDIFVPLYKLSNIFCYSL